MELSRAAGSRLTSAHRVRRALAERRASSTHGAAGVPLHSPRTSEGQHSRSPSDGTEPTPPGQTNGLPPGRRGPRWGTVPFHYSYYFVFYSKLVIPLVVALDDDGFGKNPMIQRKEQVGTLRSYSPPTG